MMTVEFYFVPGDEVTIEHDIETSEGLLSKGQKVKISSLSFTRNLANYNLEGYGKVAFNDYDFEKGANLKKFNRLNSEVCITL